MKLTYSNITSTIALFAALTTGTSYAANVVLARDSVRSTNIKNGQVTMADLHPTLRKKLAGTTTGGATTPKPPTGGGTLLPVGTWKDTGVLTTATWPEANGVDGTKLLTSMIGTTGNVEFRVVGNLTKPEGTSAQATIYFNTISGQQVAGWGFGLGWQQSGTFASSELAYQPTNSIGTDPKVMKLAAKNAQTISAIYGGTGATSTLRVQVRRVA